MTDAPLETTQPMWRPLTREQRRVVGALIEKAKTTPDSYPLTVNAIVAACNQKNNRSPLMELDATEVEMALDALRHMGAVTEIQGSGRVAKYRHNMYQWLGVDKVELAVMAELLLRGQQSVGDLRGRAARMEPIADMNELRPILDSLVNKRLLVELTPAGRGQIVTHNLYEDREILKIRELVGREGFADESHDGSTSSTPRVRTPLEAGDDDVRVRLREMQQLIDSALQRIEQLEARLRS